MAVRLQMKLGVIAEPDRVTDSPDTIGAVDLLVVAVKTYDLEAAAERSRPLVGPHTMVLPLQNGIDSYERVAPIVGAVRCEDHSAVITALG